MRVLQPKNVFLEGAKKHEVKKVIISKNAFSKSCPKFYKLGDDFFYFDEISKLWILEPKNVFAPGPLRAPPLLVNVVEITRRK